MKWMKQFSGNFVEFLNSIEYKSLVIYIWHSNIYIFFFNFEYKVAVLFWANQFKYFLLLKNSNIRCKWKLFGVNNPACMYMFKVNIRNTRTQTWNKTWILPNYEGLKSQKYLVSIISMFYFLCFYKTGNIYSLYSLYYIPSFLIYSLYIVVVFLHVWWINW